MAKTNIQHLRELVNNNIESTHKAEILEFIDAVQVDLVKKDKEIEELEDEELSEARYDNNSFVGLDTINWSLEKGNILIEMEMESFVKSLQKQNCATAV